MYSISEAEDPTLTSDIVRVGARRGVRSEAGVTPQSSLLLQCLDEHSTWTRDEIPKLCKAFIFFE